jgi:hypothetical protein
MFWSQLETLLCPSIDVASGLVLVSGNLVADLLRLEAHKGSGWLLSRAAYAILRATSCGVLSGQLYIVFRHNCPEGAVEYFRLVEAFHPQPGHHAEPAPTPKGQGFMV